MGIFNPSSSGGGGSPGGLIVRKFPFAFNTPGILTGAPLYTPTVGDMIYDAIIVATTAWNGLGTLPGGNPGADIGLFTSGQTGLRSSQDGPWALMASTEIRGVLSGFANGGSTLALRGIFPALITSTDPICVCVTQDGHVVTAAAFVLADTLPALPLTVVTGTNDEFVFTPITTGIPETFTVAAGIYATVAETIVAMGAATGSADGEAFSTLVTPTDSSGSILLTAVVAGPIHTNDTITAGTNDVSAALGFTGNPDTFNYGTGGDPGATQGAAVLFLATVTPA